MFTIVAGVQKKAKVLRRFLKSGSNFQIPVEVEGYIQLTPSQFIAAARPYGSTTTHFETFASSSRGDIAADRYYGHI